MRTLAGLPIAANPRYVKDDITALRRAFPKDEEVSQALRAVTSHLRRLRRKTGTALDHDLNGWRRVKFSSGITDRTDLRIVFRPAEGGFELRAFGPRYDPESVYFKAASRGSYT